MEGLLSLGLARLVLVPLIVVLKVDLLGHPVCITRELQALLVSVSSPCGEYTSWMSCMPGLFGHKLCQDIAILLVQYLH